MKKMYSILCKQKKGTIRKTFKKPELSFCSVKPDIVCDGKHCVCIIFD